MVEHVEVGDRVVFPHGLAEREATVIEVYGLNASRVVLLVPILGANGEVLDEYTQALPASEIRRLATA